MAKDNVAEDLRAELKTLADTLADGTNSQGRLLLLHGEPEPEQAAQE